jgi:hypothetical protein
MRIFAFFNKGVVLLVSLFFAGSPCLYAANSILLFKSGFENEVVVSSPYKSFNQWKQDLIGKDLQTGFIWPDNLQESAVSNRLKPRFSFLVSKDSVLSQFVTNRIETVPGPHGKPTKALFMEVKGDDRQFKSITRNEYATYPARDFNQGYISYWLKLQPDYLKATKGKKTWRLMMEWKEPPTGRGSGSSDYRYYIWIRTDGENAYWQLKGEKVRPERKVEWHVEEGVKVPVGRWAFVEVFWKHHRTDGRLWLKVDGKMVADHKGRTAHPTWNNSLNFWSIFKVYCGNNFFANGISAYQWIDDVEIWDGVPGNASTNPNKK